jgi:hypothetical protein
MLVSIARSRFGVAGTADTALGGSNDCSGATGHTCTLRAANQTANAAIEATVIHLPGGTIATPKCVCHP